MTNSKKIIFLFILIILVVPFYESKKIALWESQRKTLNQYFLANIFRSAVLTYASFAQEVKSDFGLDQYFEEEHSFWLKIKKSPLVFQEEITTEEELPSVLSDDGTELVEDDFPIAIGEEDEIPSNGIDEEIPQAAAGENPELVLKPIDLEAPFRVLIIGDSFIAVGGGVGDILEKGLLAEYQDLSVFRQGKVSSGLSRPDYFNWNLTIQELISQYKPNIAIIMLGSNDAQGLTNSKGVFQIYYGQPAWNQEYGQRVANFLDIFKENNIVVFWLGLPIMRSFDFSEKMKNLNSIYEQECQKQEMIFVSTWQLLADSQGNYTAYLPNENGKNILVRVSDGIHLQYAGGEIVKKELFRIMEQVLDLTPKI